MKISLKALLLATLLLSAPTQQACALPAQTIAISGAVIAGACGGLAGYAIAQNMTQSDEDEILNATDNKTKKLIAKLAATSLGFITSALLVYWLLDTPGPTTETEDAPRLVRRNAFRIDHENNVDFQARELERQLMEQRAHDITRTGIVIANAIQRN